MSSYHVVPTEKLQVAIAFVVAKKGKALRSIGVTDYRQNPENKTLRIEPAMRHRTFADGLHSINEEIARLLPALPCNGLAVADMSSATQTARVAELWACHCTTTGHSGNTIYKIRKRGVMDECFTCKQTAQEGYCPDLSDGVANLKDLERKERSLKGTKVLTS